MTGLYHLKEVLRDPHGIGEVELGGGPEIPPVQDCGGLTAEHHPSSICFEALDRRWTCEEFVLTVSEKDWK